MQRFLEGRDQLYQTLIKNQHLSIEFPRGFEREIQDTQKGRNIAENPKALPELEDQEALASLPLN